MGLISSECETCGTKVGFFQDHPLRECVKESAKKKVNENDLVPVPVNEAEGQTYQNWLENHKYTFKSLTRHPQFTAFTSEKGRNDLGDIEFQKSNRHQQYCLQPQKLVKHNGDYYINCKYDLIIKVADTYPKKALRGYIKNRRLWVEKDPQKADETPLQTYTKSDAKVGKAYTKNELVATNI